MVTASTINEIIPILCDGSRCVNGNPNPEMLVKAVVAKNTAFQLAKALPFRNPYIATKPEAIPIRLMITCKSVYVPRLMPKTIVVLLSGQAASEWWIELLIKFRRSPYCAVVSVTTLHYRP